MNVTVPKMIEARAADDHLWLEYQRSVDPDHRDYMPTVDFYSCTASK